MAEKGKYPTYVTPSGTFVYPYLNEARDYKNDGKFNFSTKFVLGGNDAATLVSLVQELLSESQAQHKTQKVASEPFAVVLDANGEEVEGQIEFKFKLPAFTKKKDGSLWERRIHFVDSAGAPLVPAPKVGGGSEGRICFEVYKWKTPLGAGVTLQPKAVQVTKLVEFQASGETQSGESYGFSAVEGGYEGTDEDGDESVADEGSADF